MFPNFVGKCFAPDRKLGRALLALSFLTCFSGDASAAYDYLALGAPKFVNTNYIDMTKITRITKYRSLAGHNYSDQTQFGQDGIKSNGNFGVVENCSSMKNYFVAPDTSVKIYAMVSGTIGGLRDGNMGISLEITADEYPDFHFGIFHMVPAAPLAVGDHVTEGQLLGTTPAPRHGLTSPSGCKRRQASISFPISRC